MALLKVDASCGSGGGGTDLAPWQATEDVRENKFEQVEDTTESTSHSFESSSSTASSEELGGGSSHNDTSCGSLALTIDDDQRDDDDDDQGLDEPTTPRRRSRSSSSSPRCSSKICSREDGGNKKSVKRLKRHLRLRKARSLRSLTTTTSKDLNNVDNDNSEDNRGSSPPPPPPQSSSPRRRCWSGTSLDSFTVGKQQHQANNESSSTTTTTATSPTAGGFRPRLRKVFSRRSPSKGGGDAPANDHRPSAETTLRVLECSANQQQQQPQTGTLYHFTTREPNDDGSQAAAGEQATITTRWAVPCSSSSTKRGIDWTNPGALMSYVFRRRVLPLFMPVGYPHSVVPGYAVYSLATFFATVALHAGTVLSTQVLLTSLGAVQATMATTSAVVLSAMVNWAAKDSTMGQLVGGLLTASYANQHLDSSPKRWRMMAAHLLDLAGLLELSSRRFVVGGGIGTSQQQVASIVAYGIAFTALLLKNAGFSMASACRAALHPALCRDASSSLANVTAKANLQAATAGWIGTGVGMLLALLCRAQEADLVTTALVLVALIHEGCTYMSLLAVPLSHFDRHRLAAVVEEYLERDFVMSPPQVAQVEKIFPSLSAKVGQTSWLTIGSSLPVVCPNGLDELQSLMQTCSYPSLRRQDEKDANHPDDDDEHEEECTAGYIVNIGGAAGDHRHHHDDRVGAGDDNSGNRIHLVFFKRASGKDVIRGMLHACLLRQVVLKRPRVQWTRDARIRCIERTAQLARDRFDRLERRLRELGWKTDTVSVESSGSLRLDILPPAKKRDVDKYYVQPTE